ncbi:MAG: DUF2569 family protein [Phycisphaerales bacterium]
MARTSCLHIDDRPFRSISHVISCCGQGAVLQRRVHDRFGDGVDRMGSRSKRKGQTDPESAGSPLRDGPAGIYRIGPAAWERCCASPCTPVEIPGFFGVHAIGAKRKMSFARPSTPRRGAARPGAYSLCRRGDRDAILLVYTATRFFGERRNTPRVMIAFLIVRVIANGLLLVINLGGGAESFAIECAKAMVKGAVSGATWIPYFAISQRVKRTFVAP